MTHIHTETVVAPGTAPTRQLLVLHGIYGAGRNWSSVARRLVRARPDWGVELVDLRSHGRSPRLSPHTVEACARDLVRLEGHLGRRMDAVLGHSFGGKVALVYAGMRWGAAVGRGAGPVGEAVLPRSEAQAGGQPLRQLWVVDASPGAGRAGGSAWRMLGVLRRHPGPFGSRAEAVDAVESEGFSTLVAKWMATNAVPTDNGLEWRLDADEMEAYLRDYFRTDAWGVVVDPPGGTEIHFVRALGSRVLDEAAVPRIREAAADTGRVYLHEVEGGHWVNTENPDALHGLLAAGLG
ncbi:MAG: alpha/beta hydrolase [Gemmatimonadota bacterium]|nr:alpha/beta hydrolase [Gemmatimonadota bacterium]